MKIFSRPIFLSRGFTIALFQIQGKVLEVRDRLNSLVIKGQKASGCVLSSLVEMVSDRQVVGFALDSSHLTLLRVTGLKDNIIGRSFGKVIGTHRWSSGLKDLHMVSILFQKKHAKPSASDVSELVALGLPKLFNKGIQESKQFPLITMSILYSCIQI